jgi:hypothetical protein
VIVSVPHTGTRTLQRILGVATIYHFCQNEREFTQIDEPIDFPIREPLATSLSWRNYQPDREDMDEFRRWDAAIAYLSEHPHTIHRMEDHPVLDGKGPTDTWWHKAYLDHDLDALKELPEVRYLLEWYPRVEAFFKPYYEDLWWHKKQETLSS